MYVALTNVMSQKKSSDSKAVVNAQSNVQTEPKLNVVNRETVEPVSKQQVENLVKNGRTESTPPKSAKSPEKKAEPSQVKEAPKQTVVEPYSKSELATQLAQFASKNGHPIASATMAKLSTSDIVAFIRLAKVSVDEKRMPKVETPTNPAK